MQIDCRHCRGTGKVAHDCFDLSKFTSVKKLWGGPPDFDGAYEAMHIMKCQICGNLFKVRFQCDPGTGHDDIWIGVGEESRGYAFTPEEAALYGYVEQGCL